MTPVILRDILPSAHLEKYVRKYQVFRFVFDKAVTPPAKFHACRPEHSLTFYIRDAQKFSPYRADTVLTYPPCVINGIYTSPILRYGGCDFWAVKVVFQPTALFQLIRVHMQELTDNFINAEDVFGNEIKLVWEQMCGLENLSEIINTVERYLTALITKASKHHTPFHEAVSTLITLENAVSLEWLADQSCLSIRQFIRKFEEHTGIGARTFQRIIRFDKAYRMKNTQPNLDWLSIAVACGYHDYQHLVRDFKEFTGLTPPAFYEIEKNHRKEVLVCAKLKNGIFLPPAGEMNTVSLSCYSVFNH